MDLMAAAESVRYVHTVLTLFLRETQVSVAKILQALIKRDKRGGGGETQKTHDQTAVNLPYFSLYFPSDCCLTGCPQKHFVWI